MFARLGGEEELPVRIRPSRLLRPGALVCLIAVAGCGGGERQDEDEPEGEFALDVVSAMFPERQKLAQSSDLVITVRNAGDEAVPNVAITLTGLDYRSTEPGLSDPERPQFAVNGIPREIGGFPEAKDATPVGCDTAYVNTWACGRLRPGAEKTFVWSVTAVKAGDYDISWRGRRRRRRGAERQLLGDGVRQGARRAHRRGRQERRQRDALT
jgi:hypothetical protein